MHACAYCGTAEKLTKEHVLPSWLCEATADYSAQVVRTAGGLNWDPNNLTTKDVCGRCNNGELSRLDSFALACWKGSLSRIVLPEDGTFSLPIDRKRLTRWLAKVAFNMARAKTPSGDIAVLADLGKFILDEGPPPRRVALYHGVLMPTVVPAGGTVNPGNSPQVVAPEGIRISVMDDPRVIKRPLATARIISLHSHVFFLLVSSKPQPDRAAWRRALATFEKHAPMARAVSDSLLIAPSDYDVVSFGQVAMARDIQGYARSIARGMKGTGGRSPPLSPPAA